MVADSFLRLGHGRVCVGGSGAGLAVLLAGRGGGVRARVCVLRMRLARAIGALLSVCARRGGGGWHPQPPARRCCVCVAFVLRPRRPSFLAVVCLLGLG